MKLRKKDNPTEVEKRKANAEIIRVSSWNSYTRGINSFSVIEKSLRIYYNFCDDSYA